MRYNKKSSKNERFVKFILYIIIAGLLSFSGFFNYLTLGRLTAFNTFLTQQAEEMSTNSFGKLLLEAIKKRPVYIELPGADKIQAIVDDYESTTSIWSLVNKTHALAVDYIPNNLKIPDVSTRTDKSTDERSVRADIEPALIEMFTAAKEYGYDLMIGSGYRSATQQAIYFNSLASAIGETAANISIAYPGQSEHQTGLATDISYVSRECYLDDCFAYTNGGEWLANNSYKYGFILRYPSGKEDITGYRYESWHFRYVGVDLATALYQSKLTLDEAWPYMLEALNTLKQHRAIE